MALQWTGKKKNLRTHIPDRKLFPLHWAPDRHGNEYPPIRGTPNCGPGCYDTYLKYSLNDNLEKKPESKIGYVLGARTAVRFLPQSEASIPNWEEVQSSVSSYVVPAASCFVVCWDNKQSQRRSDGAQTSSPGTYEPNKPRNRQVTWPMKFGSPDWNLVPAPKKRTLRIELASDKEFRKHRNRVAYFSLYFT
ncbi:ciliary microtubule-associated protein 3-like [Cetorhinus maximus]